VSCDNCGIVVAVAPADDGQSITLNDKLINWLDKHKIYFEVCSYVVLGIMGILLSIAGLTVSQTANNIAQEQLNVSHMANMPIFNLSGETRLAYLDNDFYEDIIAIVIQNTGGQITNASVRGETHLEFELWDKDAKDGYVSATGILYGAYTKYSFSYDGSTNSFTLERRNVDLIYRIPTSIMFSPIINEPFLPGIKIKKMRIVDFIYIDYYDYTSVRHIEKYEITSSATLQKAEPDNYAFKVDFEGIDLYDEYSIEQTVTWGIYDGYVDYKGGSE